MAEQARAGRSVLGAAGVPLSAAEVAARFAKAGENEGMFGRREEEVNGQRSMGNGQRRDGLGDCRWTGQGTPTWVPACDEAGALGASPTRTASTNG